MKITLIRLHCLMISSYLSIVLFPIFKSHIVFLLAKRPGAPSRSMPRAVLDLAPHHTERRERRERTEPPLGAVSRVVPPPDLIVLQCFVYVQYAYFTLICIKAYLQNHDLRFETCWNNPYKNPIKSKRIERLKRATICKHNKRNKVKWIKLFATSKC